MCLNTTNIQRLEYLRPPSFPLSFPDLIRLLRVKGRGDKRLAKLLVLLLRVKNSMYKTIRISRTKKKGDNYDTFCPLLVLFPIPLVAQNKYVVSG